LIEFVVGELKQGAAPADITYELCCRAGVQWPEAEAFVRPFVQQRRLKQRQKPKPIVGLAVFIGIVVLVVGIGAGVAKVAIDRGTVAPIIYEAATPIDGGLGRKLYRERWVEAGQIIEINYDVNVQSGRLTISVGQEWSQHTSKGLYDMAREVQFYTLRQTGRGQIQYPVTDTGWYHMRVSLADFAGRCEVAWEVH
jgi:hypothetical protein